MTGGGRCQIEGSRIAAQRLAQLVVGARQVEEYLVRLLLVLEKRRVVGLDEVDVEIARRCCRRPFVRRSEEQISLARGFALAPFELVLPDLVPSNVGFVRALITRRRAS